MTFNGSLGRRCPTIPYLMSRWLCHMWQSRLHLHLRNWPVDGGKSFGNESGKDWWCFMVFHKSPTIRFTIYTSGCYSSTFLRSAQSRRGVRQWLVTEGSCQSADSPLLQLSTSHQELPTRTHPDHCSYGSQQPDCSRLDYCNSLLLMNFHL